MAVRFVRSQSTVRLMLTSILAVATGLLMTVPSPVLAFQDGAPAAEAPAADAPAAAAPAEAAPAQDATAAPIVEKSSMLTMIAVGLGWLWGPIFLLVSFILVAIMMMNILALRRDSLLPVSFVEMFEQKLQSKDYQGAYEMARADDSFVARVLAAGLGRLNRGYDDAVQGMQEVGDDESLSLEQRVGYLALIGAVAPMLGLLGTVQGMITSFEVIATSESAPKPKDLAGGISTAMVTTLAGLVLAIPAMISFTILKNRLAKLLLEIGTVSEGLMARFNRKPTGGAAPAPAPAQQAE